MNSSQSPIHSPRLLARLASVALGIALIQGTSIQAATTLYWNPGNGTGTANWDAAATNWSTTTSGAGTTGFVTTDAAFFSSTGYTDTPFTAVLDGALSVAGITFNSGVATITATGAGVNGLTLTGGITINSTAGATTLDSSLGNVLTNSQTWTNNSSGTFTVNSNVINSSTSGTATLTLAGSGNTVIGGTLANNGAGLLALTDNSAGLLILGASNSYTGATAVNSGTMSLQAAGAITNSAITVGAATLNETVTNAISGTSSLNLGAAGAVVNLSQANNFTGTISIGNFSTAVLTLSNFNAIASSGTLSNTGGVIKLVSNTSGTFATNTINTTAGSPTITVDDIDGTTTGQTLGVSGTLMPRGGGTINITSTHGYTLALANVLLTGTSGQSTTINPNNAFVTIGNITSGTSVPNTVILGGNTPGNAVTGSISNGTGGAVSVTVNTTASNYGGGQWILSGSNAYTGATTVSAGALQLTNNFALGTGTSTTSGVTVFAGGALQLAGNITPATVGLTINGVGSAMTGISNGALENVSGTNTWAGTVTLAAASTIGSDAGLLRLTGSLVTGNNTLTLTGSGNGLLTGSGTGTGGLTKNGVGKWTISGTNTYTGVTTVNAGTLALDFTQAGAPASNIINNAANTSTLVLGGGTLNLISGSGTNSQRFASGTFNAGQSGIVLSNTGSNPLGLTLGAITRNAGSTLNVVLPSGAQSGSNGVSTSSTTFTSNGVLVSAASNGIAFATVGGSDWAALSGSNIVAFSNYANDVFTTGSNVNVTGADTASGTFNVNTLRLSAANSGVTLAGTSVVSTGGILVTSAVTSGSIAGSTIVSGAGKELVIINNGNLDVSSVIGNSASGVSALTLSGSGATSLSAANTYTGNTYIDGGTVTLNNSAALSSGTLFMGTGGNATLKLNSNNITLAGLSGGDSSDSVVNGGATSATLTVNAGNATYNGILADGTGGGKLSINLTGGTLAFSQAAINNTFSGGLTVGNGATLQLGNGQVASNAEALGTIVSGGTIASGPVGTGTLTLQNGATIATRSNPVILANAVSISGTVNVNGAGASYALSFDQTGMTNPNAFTLAGNTTLVNTNTVITINDAITAATPGYALTITGSAGSSGGTTVNGTIDNTIGVLTLNYASGGSAPITLTNTVNNSGDINVNQLSGGQVTLSGTVTNAGNITLTSGIGGGGGLKLSGFVNNTGYILNSFGGSGNGSLNISAAIGSNVTAVVQNNLTASMVLSGSNTAFAGGVTLNAGMLQLGSATALGTGTFTINGGSGSTLLDSGSSGLVLTTVNPEVWNGDFSFVGSNTLNLGTGSVTITGNRLIGILRTNGLTVGGAIGDGGNGYGISKFGIGPLTLTGTNTYTGATTVYGGALQAVDGVSLPTASNLVLNGGILQTTGTFTRALGTGSGQVQFGAGGGGFGGNGAAVTIAIGGTASPASLVWGTGNFLANGAPLIFASTSSASNVTFLNNLDLNGGAQTITVNPNSTETYTVSGVISDSVGTGSLIKNGPGTIVLSATETYAGPTVIRGGGIKLTGKLNSSSNLTLDGGSTAAGGGLLAYGGGGVSTFNYAPSSGNNSQALGALAINSGDGYVQSTVTGGTNLLTFSSYTGRSTGAAVDFVTTGGTTGTTNKIVLTGQGAGFMDQATFFTGTSGVGNYAWYDSGGYVRGINYGTANTANSGDAGAYLSTGSVTSLTGTSFVQTSGAVSAQATQTFTTLQLSGTNPFTLAGGATVTTNGILRTSNTGTATMSSTISGGTGIQAANNADLVIRPDLAIDNLTISTSILANGTNNLIKSGAGVLTLSGSSNYTGNTYVNAGTLTLTGTLAGTGNVFVNGGTLSINVSNALASTANLTVNAGAFNYQQNESGTLANFTQNGGTTNLFDNNAGGNTKLAVTGTTTLNGGTWSIGNMTSGNYGSSWTTGALKITGGNNSVGSVAANGTLSPQLVVGAGGMEIDQTASGPFTALTIGTVNTSVNLTPAMSLSGTLLYVANPNNTNATTIAAYNTPGFSAGQIQLVGTQTFNIGHSAASGPDLIINPIITNSGTNVSGITKTGSGILGLMGPNTFTGAVSIQNGAIMGNSVATGSNAQSLGENSTLTLGLASTSSGTFIYTGTSAATLDKAITALGNGGDMIQNNSGALLTVSGPVVKDGTKLTLNSNAGGILVTGLISGTSAGSDLLVTGASRTTLNSANTYNGPTIVYGGGTLVNGVNDALSDTNTGGVTNNTALTLGNGESSGTNTYDLAGFNQTLGGLSTNSTGSTVNQVISSNGSGGASVNTAILETNIASGTSTFGGRLGGSGSANNFALNKTGAGTLVLSGSNSFTGGTTINSGTLVVNGILSGAGDVQVGPVTGATLGGKGTINGAVTLYGGLTSADAGNINLQDGSIGTLTLGNGISIGAGGGFNSYLYFDLGVTAGSTDLINITGGTASVGGGIISVDALGSLAVGNYTLISAAGGGLGTNFTLSSTTLVVGGTTYTLSLANSTSTAEILTISSTGGGTTSTTYTLTAIAGSTNILTGGTTNITSSITNTGTGSADTLNYAGLGASSGTGGSISGSTTSGTGLAQGQSGTNNGQVFTGTQSGAIVVNPVGTGTNGTLGTGATATGTTSVTVNVYDPASLSGAQSGTGTVVALTALNASGTFRASAKITADHGLSNNQGFTDVAVAPGTQIDPGNSVTVASFDKTNRLNGTYTATKGLDYNNVTSSGSAITGGTGNTANVGISVTVSGQTAGAGQTFTATLFSGQKYGTTTGSTSSGYGLTSNIAGDPHSPTTATLINGTASANTTVSMTFNTVPSAGAAHDTPFRASDILSLGGIVATGTLGPDNSILTDKYVLQLSYDPSATGAQYIGWYDANQSQWVNAIAGNSTGAGLYDGTGEFFGSYAAYLATLTGPEQLDLAFQLNAFGYDPTTHTTWAVLDHNSEFAVIPEPGTWGMILSGFGMLIGFQRLRRRRVGT